ncbi:hypothetical protein MLD52_00060 [Puniceicoccaceae bacterium K14]|nr:hypothetical protein [Puniceicoccaceae bacterium K14]
MKLRLAVLFTFIISCLATTSAVNAESSQIQATVVLASSDGTGVDPQLKRFGANLKKLFRHDSFKLHGRSNTEISLPGTSTLTLGRGYQLKLDASPAKDGRIRLKAKWIQGSRVLIETTLVVSRNRPSLLGGPKVKQGELILILVAR